jgi:type I restriction enzyme M protein
MLDADTKRRIDTARNILIGKVPDPKEPDPIWEP